jgi:hypothetical protein
VWSVWIPTLLFVAWMAIQRATDDACPFPCDGYGMGAVYAVVMAATFLFIAKAALVIRVFVRARRHPPND